jgi:Zn-dependent M28 family amino/carboxypeptidase
MADLRKQVAFGPRVPGTKSHDECRDWLKAELTKTCDTVFLQPFTHKWSKTGKVLPMDNIVGEVNWKDATVRVALVAHWDTRPTADQEYDAERAAKPIPGANDGASGVAVLLELARNLKALPLDKSIGVRFVLVDGEDVGPGLDEMFLGASYYAKSSGRKGDYGILLDMIGDKDLRVPKEPNSNQLAPKLTTALYEHAKVVGLASTFPDTFQSEIYDDHLSLNAAGIPTVDLIDFTYPYWHTLEDTVDKCSPTSLQKVGKLLETWLRKNPVWKP